MGETVLEKFIESSEQDKQKDTIERFKDLVNHKLGDSIYPNDSNEEDKTSNE